MNKRKEEINVLHKTYLQYIIYADMKQEIKQLAISKLNQVTRLVDEGISTNENPIEDFDSVPLPE